MIAPIVLDIAVVLIGVFLLLYEALAKDSEKTFVGWLGAAGLGLVFILTFFAAPEPGPAARTAPFWNFYTADFLAMFFKRIALLTAAGVLLIGIEYRGVLKRYLAGEGEEGLGEFYALPVLTCAGLMFMASAKDFVLIFVSLELVTISFYILVASMRRSLGSLEAGVKYLILGALSTGFFLYGIAWIFGITGQTRLDAVAAVLPQIENGKTALLFGALLLLVGLGFKVAAVPFHLWVPDVYQGAPTPVTAFLSVGSKAAGFIVLMRVVETLVAPEFLRAKIVGALAVLAGMTLILGNLAAMPQGNLKRLLAYSSIAHAGYLLVAVASVGSTISGTAVSFYLASYLLMTLLAFAVMVVVANATGGDDIAHFGGLAKRSPFMAFAMLVAMLSLAGMPLTAGFIGKMLVFAAAFDRGHFVLLGIGAITVAAGFYYYLKVVRAMYWQEPTVEGPIASGPATRLMIGALIALIFLFGVYPQPILKMLAPKGGPVAAIAGR
jgi:NADH-quinone oxidoreductase subunit N